MEKTAKPIKPPAIWLVCQPGESFNSRLPLHKLEALRDQLAAQGLHYYFTPSETGYRVNRGSVTV